MYKFNTDQLKFRHFVIDREGVIFASAKDGERVANFLINPLTGNVLTQSSQRFEALSKECADEIRRKAEQSYNLIPIYRVPYFDLS
jgi:hypothetical protein